MSQKTSTAYQTSYGECLNQLETLHWKYDLPSDVESRLDDIIDQGRMEQDREQTAERVGALIKYIMSKHGDHDYADQLRQYLNGVMTALYGNEQSH